MGQHSKQQAPRAYYPNKYIYCATHASSLMPRGFSETKAYYKKNAFYKIFHNISLKTSYGVAPF